MNRGNRNSKGRVVYHGPRGGRYVVVEGRKRYLRQNAFVTRVDAPPTPPRAPPTPAGPSSSRPLGPKLSRNGAFVTALAAAKFKRGIFQDPVSLDYHPRREGMVVDRVAYHPSTIRALAARGHATVPHSRRPFTADELRAAGATPPVTQSHRRPREPQFAEQNHERRANLERATALPLPTGNAAERAAATSHIRALLRRLGLR